MSNRDEYVEKLKTQLDEWSGPCRTGTATPERRSRARARRAHGNLPRRCLASKQDDDRSERRIECWENFSVRRATRCSNARSS